MPVVGGAVSDALGSIVSSLSLVRGATGAFGILAVLLIALPVFAELLLWLMTLNLCAVGPICLGRGKRLPVAQRCIRSGYFRGDSVV